MRKPFLKWMSLISVALAVYLLAPQRAAADDEDPPSRVARLAFTGGNVSFNPAGTDDWVAAVVNRPMTTGDKLWSDDNSRAELHLGYAVIRLSDHTGFSFLNLTDEMTQLRLTEGTLNIRVRRLGDDETFEVDTPNLAFSILRPGSYRINVNEAGDATVVAVRNGEGEITGGGSAYTMHAREEGVFNGTDYLDADIQRGQSDENDFDHWCYDRDRREEHSASARYVSDDVVGYEDLDEYGGWRPVPEYGNVWFPHTVIVGWAPYRYGHWVWISPWGWTWVDDEPWGFAPFHYGRWAYVENGWCWVPGPVVVRPVYAPALVVFVGDQWHFASGPGVGWFPLAPGEVYVPAYRASRVYVNRVNVTNTVVNVTKVTNVYNTYITNITNKTYITQINYINRRAPNAVTAVSHETFINARPVAKNIVRVSDRDLAEAPVTHVVSIAPVKASVLGAGVPVKSPPPQIVNRPVIARQIPMPARTRLDEKQNPVPSEGAQPPTGSKSEGVRPQPVPRQPRASEPEQPREIARPPNGVRSEEPIRPQPPAQPERPTAIPRTTAPIHDGQAREERPEQRGPNLGRPETPDHPLVRPA